MPKYQITINHNKNTTFFEKNLKKLKKVEKKLKVHKKLNTQKLPYKAPCNDNPPPVPPQEFIAEMDRVKKIVEQKRGSRGFAFPSIADIWLNNISNQQIRE